MPGRDPGGKQSGGLLVAAGALRDVDQRMGEGPVVDVGLQQLERLVAQAVPGEQPRERRQRRPAPVSRAFGTISSFIRCAGVPSAYWGQFPVCATTR